MPSLLIIKPLSEVPSDLVRSYLARQGMPAAIIDWKYYDTQFNRQRPRGCAWLGDRKVLGFLGLIPFPFNRDCGDEAAWCCDWSIDSSQSGTGAGIMLVKHAQDLYRCLFGIEGSEITRKLFPRLATSTFPAAGLRMQLNLRLGAYTQRISNRFPALSMNGWPYINQIPLQLVREPRREPPVRIDPGVSPAITPLLEMLRSDPWRPGYNLEYIEWQIGRCPVLVSHTCYFPETAPPKAAIVYWRDIRQASWRIAIWALETALDQARSLLAKVIREIYQSRGTCISVVVSHANAALIAILSEAGFARWPDGMPLYALTPRRTDPIPVLSHLSYLDCDLAYRF